MNYLEKCNGTNQKYIRCNKNINNLNMYCEECINVKNICGICNKYKCNKICYDCVEQNLHIYRFNDKIDNYLTIILSGNYCNLLIDNNINVISKDELLELQELTF